MSEYVNIIDNIKVGSKLKFKVACDGIVNEIWSEVFDGIRKEYRLSEIRLCVDHIDGGQSYHTFRHDGVSQHTYEYDIIEII